MTKFNEEYKLNVADWEAIANYMDDEKRETVHMELAPCTEEEFLNRYIELDEDFEELLKSEFGIEL